MTSEHEPENLVEAAEELQRRVDELRDLAEPWKTSLSEERDNTVPGLSPPPPDLQIAAPLHGALSSLAGGIKSGLREYKEQRPKGDLTAFAEWVKTHAS